MDVLETLKVVIEAEIGPIKQKLKEVKQEVKRSTDVVTKDTSNALSSVKQEVEKTNNTVTKQTSNMGSAFKKLGKTILAALSLTALISFGKSCIEIGSDLAEVQNVVDVTFGEMSEQIEDFSKTAITQFGLSELSAKQYSSTMGAMLKSMGLVGDTVYEMSTNLTGLAGDLASFYNLTGDEAFAKIRAGISGETEPLKQLGINMSVANMEAFALSKGITTAYNSMSQADQALLRYNYLLSVTKDAQGDFARTSDSWANQTKILAENFNSIKASIGQGLINVFTPVIRVINNVILRLKTLADTFNDFTASLFGKAGSSDVTEKAATDISGMADSMGEAESSATSIKRALAGFDKLNNISSSDNSNSGSSSTGTNFNVSGIETQTTSVISSANDQIRQMLDNVKSYIKDTFSDVLSDSKKNLNTLKNNFQKVWKDISKLKTPLTNWFNNDFKKYFETLVKTASGNLNNILTIFNTTFSDIWNIAVYPMLQKFTTDGLPMLTQFSAAGAETIGKLNDEIAKITLNFWNDTAPDVLGTVSTVFSDCIDIIKSTWDEYGSPIFDGIGEAIENTSAIIQNVWNTWLKPIYDNTMECIDNVWTNHLAPLLSNVSEFVAKLIDTVLTIYNKWIAPIANFLQQVLAPVFSSVFTNIRSIVWTIIGNIIDRFGGIITTLKGILDFIKGVFTADWRTAWNGIKVIFKGVWETFSSAAKVPINLVIGMINTMINGVESAINAIIKALNHLSFTVPNWVPGIGGEKFGFNLSTVNWSRITYLAKGGIVSSATPAIIGEAGKEAVLPLENNMGWLDKLGKSLSKYSDNSKLANEIHYLAEKVGNGNIYLVAELDGEVIYKNVVKRSKENYKQTGNYDFAI